MSHPMPRAMYRLLVVEGNATGGDVLATLFEESGFRVLQVDTCELGIRRAKTYRPDATILDMGPSDRTGLQIIENVRSWSPMPIIVLNDQRLEHQRLAAFDLGA